MLFLDRSFSADQIYIIPVADLHVGDPHFQEAKFKKFQEWIQQEPSAYVVLLGDLINAATKNSVSDVYAEKFNPQQSLEKAYALLSPIAPKILGATAGNHDLRIWKESGIDVVSILAHELRCPYDPHGLYFQLRVGNNTCFNYTIYCTHGSGGGRTLGAKINALDRLKDVAIADIYLMSHHHGPIVYSDYIHVPDTRHKRISYRKRLFVLTGSFLGWGGYSEAMSLRPLKTGVVRVRLDGQRFDFHASV